MEECYTGLLNRNSTTDSLLALKASISTVNIKYVLFQLKNMTDNVFGG